MPANTLWTGIVCPQGALQAVLRLLPGMTPATPLALHDTVSGRVRIIEISEQSSQDAVERSWRGRADRRGSIAISKLFDADTGWPESSELIVDRVDVGIEGRPAEPFIEHAAVVTLAACDPESARRCKSEEHTPRHLAS